MTLTRLSLNWHWSPLHHPSIHRELPQTRSSSSPPSFSLESAAKLGLASLGLELCLQRGEVGVVRCEWAIPRGGVGEKTPQTCVRQQCQTLRACRERRPSLPKGLLRPVWSSRGRAAHAHLLATLYHPATATTPVKVLQRLQSEALSALKCFCSSAWVAVCWRRQSPCQAKPRSWALWHLAFS